MRMSVHERVIRVAGSAAERALRLDRVPRTIAMTSNGRALRTVEWEEPELVVLLDRSSWRLDVNYWRWIRADDESSDSDWTAPDFDDSRWSPTPHLHAVHDVSFEGFGRFRYRGFVPNYVSGEDLTLSFGGLDDEDWRRYDLWLNGTHIGGYRGGQANQIILASGEAAYAAVRFGELNTIAVQTKGLRRPRGPVPRPEQEHLFYQGWLVEQHILAGLEPTRRVDDFVIDGVPEEEPGRASIPVVSPSSGLSAVLRYWAEGDLLRKQVEVANPTAEHVDLLDIRIDVYSVGGGGFCGGGRGQPVFADWAVAGIEHPAGVAHVLGNGAAETWQWPGRRLRPGERYESATSLVVGADTGTSRRRFADYLLQARPRRRERLIVYSPLGWYDFTNPGDPRPELTQELVTENLDVLEAASRDGVNFDVYMFDDWWEPSDLSRFRLRTFPDGPGPLVERIRRLGLGAGLWVAPSRALWSARDLPGGKRSLANDLESESVQYDLGDGWSWDDEFAGLFLREERFCLASEPFGSHFRAAIPEVAAELELDLLKLDGVITHCTSAAHDHLPGRWSVEPCMDRLLRTVEAVRAARPEIFIVWYWAARSPFWLLHGDMIFDKGLKMEAATPSSTPALNARQSGNLNIDQAIRTVPHIPLSLQDSLGVWIGDVAWCNYLGKEGWLDALVLDEARGSTMVQIWGDLSLLERAERRRLAIEVERARATSDFLSTHALGGDPWRADVYGYGRQTSEGGYVATYLNPDLSRRAAPQAEARGMELGGTQLGPFEVRRLASSGRDDEHRGWSSPLTVERHEIRFDREAGASLRAELTIGLPELDNAGRLAVTVRLQRDGVWWYHSFPPELFDVTIRVAGRVGEPPMATRLRHEPAARARNGPGAPWATWWAPTGPSWSGKRAIFTIEHDLGGDVSVEAAALIVRTAPEESQG